MERIVLDSKFRETRGMRADEPDFTATDPAFPVFSGPDRATLKAVFGRARTVLSEAEIVVSAKAALNAYRADFDTSYRQKSA